jgi:hypothetical protein
VRIEPGRVGQFDVIANGEVVASRSRNPLLRLLRAGWPKLEAVVTALEARSVGE